MECHCDVDWLRLTNHHKTQNHCKCPDIEIKGHFLFHTSLNNGWKWPAGANTEAGPGGGGGHEE